MHSRHRTHTLRVTSPLLVFRRSCAFLTSVGYTINKPTVALEKLFDDICRSADASKGFTPFRSGIFKAYWRRVIKTRYSRALFKGAADMQQQLTGSDETLDPTRELALV